MTVKAKLWLTSLSYDQTVREVQKAGGKPYRAKQLFRAVYKLGVPDYASVSTLPASLATKLSETVPLYSSGIASKTDAEDGSAKLLVELADGECVEAALINEGDYFTACLSTQVGCPVGCLFCASGAAGMKRNLKAHEIIEQFLHLRLAAGPKTQISRVVVMGVGEPLYNLDNLVDALSAINDPEKIGLGARKITVSTVGIPDGIRLLADLEKAHNLAISLHAGDDETRANIVPDAHRFPLAEIIDAGRFYFERTGREVTCEYVLAEGLNDSVNCAESLGRLLAGERMTVNLIPLNQVPGVVLSPPREPAIRRFKEVLEGEYKLTVTVRRSKGGSARAACGQLRRGQPRIT